MLEEADKKKVLPFKLVLEKIVEEGRELVKEFEFFDQEEFEFINLTNGSYKLQLFLKYSKIAYKEINFDYQD